jgi:tryptophan-rich sensory protein
MGIDAYLMLGVFVFACAAAAASGIFFRPGRWYRQLAKPSWCPPNWLFGPVWLVIYLTIAFSGWLIWLEEPAAPRKFALWIYGLQLLLNAAWSAVFFGLRRPGLAFLEILGLWASIAVTIALFNHVSEIAAYLLIPYLLWVSFAAALNFRIWQLNPTQ